MGIITMMPNLHYIFFILRIKVYFLIYMLKKIYVIMERLIMDLLLRVI